MTRLAVLAAVTGTLGVILCAGTWPVIPFLVLAFAGWVGLWPEVRP